LPKERIPKDLAQLVIRLQLLSARELAIEPATGVAVRSRTATEDAHGVAVGSGGGAYQRLISLPNEREVTWRTRDQDGIAFLRGVKGKAPIRDAQFVESVREIFEPHGGERNHY
jgi:hypothetical protein